MQKVAVDEAGYLKWFLICYLDLVLRTVVVHGRASDKHLL